LLAVDATQLKDQRAGIDNFIYHVLPRLSLLWGPESVEVFARNEESQRHLQPAPRIVAGGGRGWTQLRLAGALRRAKADVFFNPIPVLPLLGSLPCPAVVTVYDLHEFRRRWRTIGKLLGRTLSRADAVICISNATQEELAAEFRWVRPKTEVVHLGADASVFYPRAESAPAGTILPRLGIAEAPILAVGTLQPRKNYERLISAYAALRADQLPPLVIVGGRGWQYAKIESLPGRLNVEDRVLFTGYLPDPELGELMRASCLLCAMSTQEGFGLPLVEAMHCGVPILASDIPPFREVAGNAARFVNPHDTHAITAALAALLQDQRSLAEMSLAGLGRRELFTWDRTAAAIFDVLRRAVA
jgi:glycosyltransferase involved in cell wall biosynthesis